MARSDADAGGRGRRATSYDVARAAGVSQSAVSRAFAAGASVAPATRERVLRAAADLGYRPNALAQGLISGRSNMVALLIPAHTNLVYPEVLAELSRRLTERDIRVLLFPLGAEGEVDGVLGQLWRHSVDGAISAARLSEDQVRQFDDHGVPLVLYNRTVGSGLAASVSCDSANGERMLVARLLAAGHRRFGIVAGPEDSFVGEARRSAAHAALVVAGIGDVATVRGDHGYESGRAALHELAAMPGGLPDAVVCGNDLMAIGAMDAARIDRGLRVPQDLSIVGFDGSGPAGWAGYRLATVRQPVRRMTEATVAMLVERMEDRHLPAEHRMFAGEMVEGASARLG